MEGPEREGSEFKICYVRLQVNGKDVVRSTGRTKKGEAVDEMQRMLMEQRDGTGIDDILKRLNKALSELPDEEQSENHRADRQRGDAGHQP